MKDAPGAGPGTIGPGAFDAELYGGPQGGLCFVAYGDAALYSPNETALPFGGLPLLLGLELSSMTILTTPLVLDASGELQQSFQNGGGLSGIAAQLIIFGNDLSFAGTSTAAFFN